MEKLKYSYKRKIFQDVVKERKFFLKMLKQKNKTKHSCPFSV